MAKLSIYYLSLTILLVGGGCQENSWYSKTPKYRYSSLSDRLLAGANAYYQGSPACQLTLMEGLKYDSSNASIWREMGVPYLKRGIAVKSDFYFDMAVKHDAVSWLGYRGYNYLYFYRDFDRALDDFDKLDLLTPNFVDHPQGQNIDYMRGIAHYGAERYDSSIYYLKRYIALEGEDWVDPNTYIYLGLDYEKNGDFNEAIKIFDLLIKHNPSSADAYFHKARILLSQGEVAKASEYIDVAHKKYSKGFYHQRSYVEVLDQIYEEDIIQLKETLNINLKML